MIKPLTLLPRQNSSKKSLELESPFRQRADSLVFSTTSSKGRSAKDSLLIVSNSNHSVSKQLETLQLKLQNLQSKVQRIDSENYVGSCHNQSLQPYHIFLKTQKIQSESNKQNKDLNATAVGKIITKNNRLSKNNKINTSKNKLQHKSHVLQLQSRSNVTTEDSVVFKKIKQIEKLNKKIRNMKSSVEKSQKSMSLCSERLSASKREVKNLKKQSVRKQKLIERLKGELKRSETIREKQKQVIMKQQEQLKQLKMLFASYQRCK